MIVLDCLPLLWGECAIGNRTVHHIEVHLSGDLCLGDRFGGGFGVVLRDFSSHHIEASSNLHLNGLLGLHSGSRRDAAQALLRALLHHALNERAGLGDDALQRAIAVSLDLCGELGGIGASLSLELAHGLLDVRVLGHGIGSNRRVIVGAAVQRKVGLQLRGASCASFSTSCLRLGLDGRHDLLLVDLVREVTQAVRQGGENLRLPGVLGLCLVTDEAFVIGHCDSLPWHEPGAALGSDATESARR